MQNEYSVKDSFGVVKKMQKILLELFDRGYRNFSFDVTPHLTNASSLSKMISVTKIAT